MKNQILLLRGLQTTELKIRGLREDQERYPREIQNLNEKLASEEETARQERERLQFLESERRHKEGELDQEGERIKKTKGRLFDVKTNKEYQALLHEIELMEATTSRNEDDILAILEEIDQLKGSVSEREGALVNLKKEVRTQISEIERKMSHLVEEMGAMEKRCAGIIKVLDPELMKAYETLKHKRVTALAVVRSGVCQGCYVNIPPQMFNEVQRNDALIRCPNCNRFLFWENESSS